MCVPFFPDSQEPAEFQRRGEEVAMEEATGAPGSLSFGRSLIILDHVVQWSEDKIKADPFFCRSRARFRVAPWVSNTIARDHLA